MLSIQEVANFLNDELNSISDIGYNVVAEVGESNKSSLINGILRTARADTTPIADYVENKYSFVCELLIPTGRTNKMFIKVQNVVSQFIDAHDGTKVDFTDGNGTINCTLGKPENFKVEYNVGDCTPIYFTIDMVYTESGVMSIQKEWYLSEDGGTTYYKIPYDTEDVVINKEGIVRKVDFDKYTKTFLLGQTKLYKFKFPYQNTALGNMIMKDILNGDFKKQYKLKYVDGINYIADSETNPPFVTTVSIYASGDANSQVVNVGKFDITFTDVDDGNTDTKYYIALIDWKFDASGEDTRWFTSQANQIAYFDDTTTGLVHVTGGTGWQQIKAPNLNSLFITSQVFPNDGTTKLNVFDLVRKNYAIIKVATTVGNVTTNKYIYYNASNCQIGADGQVTYDLKEDTVQTFMFNSSLNIADSFIERAHLDRFVQRTESGQTVYTYNYLKDSPLFEREETKDVSKMVVDKRKLKVAYDQNGKNSDLSEWMNEHISHWVYYYLSWNAPDDEGHVATYKWYDGSNRPQDSLTPMSYKAQNGSIASATCVLAFPIYKSTAGYIRNNEYVESGTGRTLSRNQNVFFNENNTAYVYAIKNSIMPPWELRTRTKYVDSEHKNDYKISGDNNENLDLNIDTYSVGQTIDTGWGCSFISFSGDQTDKAGFIILEQDIRNGVDLYLDNQLYEDTYTPTQVQTTNNLEPKIYNEDYSTYHIYFGGQTYDMPVLKTSNYPSFKYYEPLTPDITKFYLTFNYRTLTIYSYGENKLSTNIFGEKDTSLGAVAKPYTQKDYTGLVGSIDLSMWFSKSKLDEWLATNKNNLQIFQNNQQLQRDVAIKNMAFGITGTGLGLLSSAVSGNPIGAVGGIVSGAQGIGSFIQNKWQRENDAQNRDLTIDNMRQSPASLSSLNSNAVLIQGVDDFGIYIELQEPIPHEKQQIINHMKRYGYTVNKLGSVNSYLKSGSTNNLKRVQYVYIKALISALSGVPMSTEERIDFKQRFESGIRFWNGDSINYSLINYEYGTGA